MGLFTPVWLKNDEWGRKNLDKALVVVGKMQDEARLKEVALTAVRDEVVLLACKKIHDQRTIADAALRRTKQNLHPFRSNLAKELLALITDPALLREVAIQGDEYSIGPSAVEFVDLQEDLAEIARKAKPMTRVAAIQRLTDPETLTDIALNTQDAAQAITALRTVSDSSALARLLVRMPESVLSKKPERDRKLSPEKQRLFKVCEESVYRLEEASQLDEVDEAWKDTYVDVCKAVRQRKARLEEEKAHGKQQLSEAQQLAVKAYFDETDLNQQYKAIQEADQAVLAEIARREPEYYKRMQAFNHLEDDELRREIQASWSDEWRRSDARREMLDDGIRKNEEARERGKAQLGKGVCPYCGVRLAMLNPSVPAGSILYCSNCGKRIGFAAKGGGIV